MQIASIDSNIKNNIYPHAIRTKFATDGLKKGCPIEKISKLLGHGKCKLRIEVYGYRYSNNTNPNNKGTYVDLTNAVLSK